MTEDVAPKLCPPKSKKSENQKLREAKNTAEKAIKNRHIFTVVGPYPKIRMVMRARGWVEKFYKIHGDDDIFAAYKENRAKTLKRRSYAITSAETEDEVHGDNDDNNDDHDDDDGNDDQDEDDEVGKISPWEEDDGYYGFMSRVCRNSAPTFIFSLKTSQVNFRHLNRDQIVNHFLRSGCFTTKEGLSRNLRELPWYQNVHPDDFYPRSHIISTEDEMESFIDDYRLTACVALIKLVVETELVSSNLQADDEEIDGADAENDNSGVENHSNQEQLRKLKKKKIMPKIKYKGSQSSTSLVVPLKCLDLAMTYCQHWLSAQNHEDLDKKAEPTAFSKEKWNQFIEWYYQVTSQGAQIEGYQHKVDACRLLYEHLSTRQPQFYLDGRRNVWIIKPGAKSRGRGIVCCNKIDDIVKLLTCNSQNFTSRYVIQKYIERPLLIFNTKFDIRQWFLVTDWNPLTIWWFKEFYVRFCSQVFTLEDFDESVHLSNNSIQAKYENCANRSSNIPNYNMWDCSELKNWLRERGQMQQFEDVIYPGMKNAVINAMLCSQSIVDGRKNCFELYGADFMISDNYQSWLIEINSSPCMSPSTPVTARMTEEVLADTVKVVLDRRLDRDADTGKFEICYQAQPITSPPYVGIDLTVSGSTMRRPHPVWDNNLKVVDTLLGKTIPSLFLQEARQDNLEKRLFKKNLPQIINMNSSLSKKNTTILHPSTNNHVLVGIHKNRNPKELSISALDKINSSVVPSSKICNEGPSGDTCETDELVSLPRAKSKSCKKAVSLASYVKSRTNLKPLLLFLSQLNMWISSNKFLRQSILFGIKMVLDTRSEKRGLNSHKQNLVRSQKIQQRPILHLPQIIAEYV